MLVSHVKTPKQWFDVQSLGPKMIKIGRKNASTFKGFCKSHDSKIFSPIEDKGYENSNLQNFLFNYRACAYDYTRAQELADMYDEIRDRGKRKEENRSKKVQEAVRNFFNLFSGKSEYTAGKAQSNLLSKKQGKKTNNLQKNKLNNDLEQIKNKTVNEVENKETLRSQRSISERIERASGYLVKKMHAVPLKITDSLQSNIMLRVENMNMLLQQLSLEIEKSEEERNYDVVRTKSFVFPFFSQFAVSTVFYVPYDLDGNTINYFLEKSPLNPLFCTIFPQNNKTYVIFSYPTYSIPAYEPLFKQLDSSNYDSQEVISNLVINNAENFFMSKEKYDALNESEKSDLNSKRTYFLPFFNKHYLRRKPSLNLFQKFRV